MKPSELLHKILRDESNDREEVSGSTRVLDTAAIEQFIQDPSNTFLISFPRTGSHWLRMLMELYFERPSLVRVFYFPENTNYLSYHTHDLNLDIDHSTVIYLYRDPVETIYSQLNYHKEGLENVARIVFWSDLYGRHLDKWLYQERFTTKKTVIRYEGLKRNMIVEFAKVAGHFGAALDPHRLDQAAASTTRETVKRKTSHDQQVINLEKTYEKQRVEFSRRYSQIIWDAVLTNRPHLKNSFLD